MNYIVVDLEWNQAMSSKSSVFNKLPIHLRGEIIEIGAVKLNDDMSLGEEFTIDVKPVYFKRMHYKVKKLTGFDKERLAKGLAFPDAMEIFRDWCGEDVTFLTWGCDDRGIMEQNIIIHDLDWDWIAGWVNLQLIYNLQTGGDKNQKSLASAMEHFGIEQTRIAHDALGDAYNTALVCTHLNMEEGLKLYPDAAQILASRMPKSETQPETQDVDYLLHESYSAFATKAAAFADERIVSLSCPDLQLRGGRPLPCAREIPQARGGQHLVREQAAVQGRRGRRGILSYKGGSIPPPRPRAHQKEEPPGKVIKKGRQIDVLFLCPERVTG